PLAFIPSLTRFAVAGELVDRSMKTVPGLAFAATPPAPSVTSSTTRGIGREVITTSQRADSSATEGAAAAPRSVHCFIASGLRSNTMTSWFVLRMMLRHMGPPMFPTPMKPTFIGVSPDFRRTVAARAAACTSIARVSARRCPGASKRRRPHRGRLPGALLIWKHPLGKASLGGLSLGGLSSSGLSQSGQGRTTGMAQGQHLEQPPHAVRFGEAAGAVEHGLSACRRQATGEPLGALEKSELREEQALGHRPMHGGAGLACHVSKGGEIHMRSEVGRPWLPQRVRWPSAGDR